jgi:hypothetical protein
MAELAVITKNLDFHLEQVQDFTPTPLTNATETWYTGYDPYTLQPVFSAKTPKEKLAQRQFFFWYKPEERRGIEQSLRRIGRPDLIAKLYSGMPPQGGYRPAYGGGPKPAGSGKPSGGGKPKSYNPNFKNENSRAKHHSEKPQQEKRGRNRRNF